MTGGIAGVNILNAEYLKLTGLQNCRQFPPGNVRLFELQKRLPPIASTEASSEHVLKFSLESLAVPFAKERPQ